MASNSNPTREGTAPGTTAATGKRARDTAIRRAVQLARANMQRARMWREIAGACTDQTARERNMRKVRACVATARDASRTARSLRKRHGGRR